MILTVTVAASHNSPWPDRLCDAVAWSAARTAMASEVQALLTVLAL